MLAPALNHPEAGESVPPAAGLAVVVSKYCVVKLAVKTDEDAGARMTCAAAPESDHPEKAYWMPVPPACVAAAIECELPAAHWNEQGATQADPSTVSAKPLGVEEIVVEGGADPFVSEAESAKKEAGDF